MKDWENVIAALDDILCKKKPNTFNSSWILKYAPACHRFIHKYIRTEIGAIDWDKVTSSLQPKLQRLWRPRTRRRYRLRRNKREIELILNKHRAKLYVFLTAVDAGDERIRDNIATSLVRSAQTGNVLATKEISTLVRYTVEGWLDKYHVMSRWKHREGEIQKQIEGCIRRYRYSGSFLRYVFWTLHCAARGIPPSVSYVLKRNDQCPIVEEKA
jgi:hypothetical protein